MTLVDAKHRAVLQSWLTQTDRFIVWEHEDGDNDGEHYHVAGADELDTFYAGQTALFSVSPCGIIDGPG